MRSSPALPCLYLAVIGISAWRLLQGFRTGIMQFGAGTINISCDRRNDPRGFWIYGAFNAFIGTLSIWGLFRVFGYI